MKRILREKVSTVEVAISKCMGGGRLHPSEIEEIRHITQADLMSEHGLDSLMAEKVVTHLKTEILRQRAQSLMTWQVDSRESRPDPAPKASATNTIREGNILEDLNFMPEDIMDMEMNDHPVQEPEGRMLDYGHVKSDSREGKMMRQALYEISEYSKGLHDLLTDDDDLPQWCHYKIAVARACVGKVAHYLEYKIKRHEEK